jgi:hypothetical protein
VVAKLVLKFLEAEVNRAMQEDKNPLSASYAAFPKHKDK